MSAIIFSCGGKCFENANPSDQSIGQNPAQRDNRFDCSCLMAVQSLRIFPIQEFLQLGMKLGGDLCENGTSSRQATLVGNAKTTILEQSRDSINTKNAEIE